jgi:hypothetical protein
MQLYQLSVEAYQKAVTLLPRDSLWHTGFADLLLQHAYYTQFSSTGTDYTELGRAVSELKTAVDLDPKNQLAFDLLEQIAGNFPEAVQLGANGYTYLILTATPVVTEPVEPGATPSETPIPIEPTNTLLPTATAQDTAAPEEATQVPLPSQPAAATASPVPPKPAASPKLPCVGSLVLFPIAGLLFIGWRGKIRKGG